MATATEEPTVKFDGKVLSEIDSLVQEYVGYHRIEDSLDPTKRVNLVNKRNDELSKIRQGLEGIISSTLGDNTHSDKATADKIVELLVAKGYEADKLKLPDDPKQKEEAVSKYLTLAGVENTQLVKAIINTRRPTSINELPDDHPLRRLITYIQSQSHEQQRRIQYATQRLVSLGDVQAPAVAEAFNKHGGTRLDSRFAKPQEAIQIYGQLVEARLREYAARDPNTVYNKAVPQSQLEKAA